MTTWWKREALFSQRFAARREDKDEYWAEDLKEDVEDECNNYGKVLHVHVDTESPEV